MATRKTVNRFRKNETVNISGFELPKYNSLLARERIALLEARKKIYSRVKDIVLLGKKVAKDLGVSEQEAWIILQNSGTDSGGKNHQERILPYLVELSNIQDESLQHQEYLKEALTTLLRSRLTAKFVNEAKQELKEAFDLGQDTESLFSDVAIAAFDDFDNYDNLELVHKLIDAFPESIFNELMEFITIEENGGVKPDDDPKQQDQGQTEIL